MIYFSRNLAKKPNVYACYVWDGYTTALAYTHTHAGRAAHAGGVRCCAAALGALSRGVVVGVAGMYACYVNSNDPLWRTRPRVTKHSAGGRAVGLVY